MESLADSTLNKWPRSTWPVKRHRHHELLIWGSEQDTASPLWDFRQKWTISIQSWQNNHTDPDWGTFYRTAYRYSSEVPGPWTTREVGGTVNRLERTKEPGRRRDAGSCVGRWNLLTSEEGLCSLLAFARYTLIMQDVSVRPSCVTDTWKLCTVFIAFLWV